MPASEITLPADGPAAPPRLNGELAFDAPWQSRIFGVTAALVEGGSLSWPAMQAALTHQVGHADAAGDEDTNSRYWTCWLAAVSQLLNDGEAVDTDAIEAEQQRLAELYAH